MKTRVLIFLLFVSLAGASHAQKDEKIVDKPDFILYFDSVPNGGTCLKSNTTLSLRSSVNPNELSDFTVTAVEMWMEKSKACAIVSGDELSANMKLVLQTAQSGDTILFSVKAINSEKVVIKTTGKFTVM